MSRRTVSAMIGVLAMITWIATACGPTPMPQVIKEVVKETVVVEKPVEVTKVVEVEKPVEVVVTATPASKGGKLTYGLLFSPSGMDPHVHLSWDLGVAVANVYDPLVYEDENGQVQPGLAESWEVSADSKSYTFKLREGVKFHDGTPFNAEAVKFCFDRIVDPETKSQFATLLLGPYESTEVIDEFTVQVNFSQPFALLLSRLGLPYLAMVSPAAVEEWGPDYQLHQVGTGPFIFKEYVPQDHLTLIRNPDYDRQPAYGQHTGPAYLEEVVFKFLPDASTRVPALEAGDVDVARELLAEQAPRLGQNPDFTLLSTPMTGQTIEFFMNTQREPTSDLRVRQALLYATDPTVSANTIFRGYFPPAYGPLSAITPEYDPSLEEMYPYDLSKAAALLDEAGWTDTDGDGIRDKDGQPLRLEMIVQAWGGLEELGQIVQGQVRQVGVDVDMEMMTFPAALQAAADGAYHLTPYGGGGWDADVLNDFFNSSAYFNWSKVNNTELDSILSQASQEMDKGKRADLYRQAQQIIMKDALILPVLSEGQLVGINNRVRGLTYGKMGLFPRFYDVYIED
jgi:peptide/nickel transport system substrate-binding protein